MDDTLNLRLVHNDSTSDIIGNSGNNILVVAERPSDGQLYGVSVYGGASLYTINKTSGASTLVHSLDLVDGTDWYDAVFDNTDTLYLTNAPHRGENSKLYTINLTSGIASLVGPIGTGGTTMNVDSVVFKNGVL